VRAVAVALAALAVAAPASAAVSRAAFAPNDPLVPRQWHLAANRAFDAWEELPPLAPVRVAVIDSGVDGKHPDLVAKIVAARSFVGGSPLVDTQGHGTFVAGLIAAETNNAIGVAGMAPSAQLVVAKVVREDRTIPLDAEAAAIRWAVDQGARVINLSLGGVRDPRDPRRDTYSAGEAKALAYAYARGAVIVAAVGNGDQAPVSPWSYASYPAALPHVIGVSALARDGSIPAFSNRDPIYNDVSAPGEDIVSTFPRALTAQRPTCVEQGYSPCGPPDYRRAEGTSFAAPQVSAAAALLLAVHPGLKPDQVAVLLERSAADANASSGCVRCPLQRDSLSGWGRLDVTAALGALQGPIPQADSYESNDSAGEGAYVLWGAVRRLEATLDFFDDPSDVYAVKLQLGQRLVARLDGTLRADANLVLWRPGTKQVDTLSGSVVRQRAAVAARPGPHEILRFTADQQGWWYVEVKLSTAGSGPYSLTVTKGVR
jgi:subtilisin family serine protease